MQLKIRSANKISRIQISVQLVVPKNNNPHITKFIMQRNKNR